MTALDLDFVRAQFPAFSEPTLDGFAHFENAGGSYACRPVIERLEGYYRRNKVQPYYPSAPSREAGELMDAARLRLAAWLNVRPEELHFGPSTSQNTYVLAQALRGALRPGDEVIVTNQDHEANVGAWRRLEEAGLVVREWQVDPTTGDLPPDGLKALLSPRTRVVAPTSWERSIPRRSWSNWSMPPGHGRSSTAWPSRPTGYPTSKRSGPTSTCSRYTRCTARTWARCICART